MTKWWELAVVALAYACQSSAKIVYFQFMDPFPPFFFSQEIVDACIMNGPETLFSKIHKSQVKTSWRAMTEELFPGYIFFLI